MLHSLDLPNGIKDLDYNDLEELANEVREKIINVTSENGGHIAPSLGVVELTLALMRVFDVNKDKIIWDVGHQTYAYKILTDRLHSFDTLRTYGGISGFSRPSESPYDHCISGHASTSIASAAGLLLGNSINNVDDKVIAVIGDGALTGGLAFEALNNISTLRKNLIIILNDNEMSISANVGGFASFLSKSITSEFATKIKSDMRSVMKDTPIGGTVYNLLKKFESMTVKALSPGVFFESLGIRYIGPIDGHKLKDIESALKHASIQHKPVVVHVATVKGKGYEFAEKSPDVFHGVSCFDISTGLPKDKSTDVSWTKAFSLKLIDMAKNHNNICAITAAMEDGTGLKEFSKQYNDRFFDVGIAEQYAVTFSAGLAIGGAKPYTTIYSTFLQRAFDQIIHDVAIPNLPVTFCIDRGGFVGADGSTHHGIFDLAYLRMIPNITIMVPKDRFELESMMELSYEFKSPVAIRYARGKVFDNDELPKNPLKVGSPEVIYKGDSKISIISIGAIFDEAYKAYNELKSQNILTDLINLRFVKPLITEELISAISDSKLIITVEDGVKLGGVGEMISSILNDNNIFVPVVKIAIDDQFYEHGNVSDLRKEANIDSTAIVNAILDHCKKLELI